MAVAQMSAMISHEFRNSLTSLKMILELQLESDNLPESENKSLQVALSSVSHMENIVTQLVSFSRPDPMQIGPVDINQITEESVQFIQVHIDKHNIQLVRKLDKSLPILNLDVLRIKEVIGNLLLNSIQTLNENGADKTGKKIIIRTSCTVLKSKTWDQSYSEKYDRENEFEQQEDQPDWFLPAGVKCLLIQVEDNGAGINSEKLKHIFDPFYTTKTSGTGLGLSLVKRVVNEHKGIITVKSSAGRGTKFNIYLPIDDNYAK